MTGQAAHTRHAGNADQASAPTLAHGLNERMKGSRQREVVGGEGTGHDIQVLALRGVHADADAGIGHHHLGDAQAGQAVLCCLYQRIGLGHIEGIEDVAIFRQARITGPALHVIQPTGHQGQTPAQPGIAGGQGLAQPAGGARDEGQWCRRGHAAQGLVSGTSTPRTRPRRLMTCSTLSMARLSAVKRSWPRVSSTGLWDFTCSVSMKACRNSPR